VFASYDWKACAGEAEPVWNTLAIMLELGASTGRQILFYDTSLSFLSDIVLPQAGSGIWQGGFTGNDTEQEFYWTDKLADHSLKRLPYLGGSYFQMLDSLAPDSITAIGAGEVINDVEGGGLVLVCSERAFALAGVNRMGGDINLAYLDGSPTPWGGGGAFGPFKAQLLAATNEIILLQQRFVYLCPNTPGLTVTDPDHLVFTDTVIQNGTGQVSQSALNPTGRIFFYSHFLQGGTDTLIRRYDIDLGTAVTLQNLGNVGTDVIRGMVFDPVNNRILFTLEESGLYFCDADEIGGAITHVIDTSPTSDSLLGLALIRRTA
jgi:hypothetical protein